MKRESLIAINWGTTPEGKVIVDGFNLINLFKAGLKDSLALKTLLSDYPTTSFIIKEDEDFETVSLVVADKELFEAITNIFDIVYLR